MTHINAQEHQLAAHAAHATNATGTAAPNVPAAQRLAQPAHVIADATEALAEATRLAEHFAVTANVRDRERLLPWTELDAFSASGLWGITVPKAFGGAGVDAYTLVQVLARIAAADGSLAQIPQNHFYALEVLRVGGSPAQHAFFYDRVLQGDRLGNALAEIGHKDFKRRTQLIKQEGAWLVDGQKFYCTGAIYAHWIPTLVTAQEAAGDVLYLAFMPRDARGVSVTDDWDGFGQRVTGSGSVRFDRVEVQPEWVVPFTTSFTTPTTIGPFAQIIHAALDAGIGRGALEATLPFVREHARPWIDAGVQHASQDPLLLDRLGDVHVRLRAADALLARAARYVDAAQAAPNEDSVAQASIAVAEAKVLATTASLLAGNRLLELAGTGGTDRTLGLDRFWRNARTHTLHDPVRWKYHAIGHYLLNGVKPPRHGAL